MTAPTKPDSTPNDAPTPTSGDGSTPAAPTPPSEAPKAPEQPSYVYSEADNVPQWMKYKTKDQLADLQQQMYTSLTRGTGLPQGVPAPQPQPQPYNGQPVTNTQPQAIDPDMWINDPAAAAAALQQQILNEGRQQFGTQLEQTYAQNAANARALAELRDPDAFKRWGPEIDMMLNTIPVAQRTAEVIQQAAELVRGRHVDDIVAERAEARARELIEQGGGTLRSGGGVPGATLSPDNQLDLNDEKLDATVRDRFSRERISDEQVTEFVIRTNIFPNLSRSAAKVKYLEMLRAGSVVQEKVG